MIWVRERDTYSAMPDQVVYVKLVELADRGYFMSMLVGLFCVTFGRALPEVPLLSRPTISTKSRFWSTAVSLSVLGYPIFFIFMLCLRCKKYLYYLTMSIYLPISDYPPCFQRYR